MNAGITAINEEVERASAFVQPLLGEMGKVVVGQKMLVERLIIGLLANGHVLLEGVPGLAKTLSIKSLANCMDAQFARLQFTPDMLPADVVGTQIYNPQSGGFSTRKGPVFANLLLADEINRAAPKVQSALLEAMQERKVTIGNETHTLPAPFLVIATQNPIEQSGTFELPEAQLDRFMLNVFIDYLPEEDEVRVVSETTRRDDVQLNPVFSAEEVLRIQGVVRKVPVADSVVRYAVRLAASSRPGQKGTPDFVNEWVNWGAGLRAGQALILGGKARALLQGRSHVTPDDVKALAVPVLRHRILPNFKAEAEGVDADKVVEKLLETVRVP